MHRKEFHSKISIQKAASSMPQNWSNSRIYSEWQRSPRTVYLYCSNIVMMVHFVPTETTCIYRHGSKRARSSLGWYFGYTQPHSAPKGSFRLLYRPGPHYSGVWSLPCIPYFSSHKTQSETWNSILKKSCSWDWWTGWPTGANMGCCRSGWRCCVLSWPM